MHLTVVINSIVCVIGTLGGLLFAGASIISIANMTVPWRGWLVGAALLIPVAFVASGISVWQADARGASQVAIALIALPWLYVGIFILAMLISFNQD